jgi:hypothetical protein
MNRRQNREIWGLIALFAVFVVFAMYSDRIAQEATTQDTPSMYNPKGVGLKAYHLLLERQGFRVADLRSDWSALKPGDGLVIIAEPFTPDRQPGSEEIEALRAWVERGGSVLYFVTKPARPLQPEDPLFGDVAIVEADPKLTQVSPVSSGSPLVENVNEIVVASPVRLKLPPSGGYEVLFKDDAGILAITRPYGKGRLVAAAATSLVGNSGIREADNAVLLVNLAANLRPENRPTVLFDEYHHGVGLAKGENLTGKEGGLLENLPVPLRLGFLHLLGFGALLVYNSNRRFGRAKTLNPPDYRPSTDYVGSLAKLYQRAGGADIALLSLHHDFARALTRHLELPPDATMPQVVARVGERHPGEVAEVQSVLALCEQVRAGTRITETELLNLARQMETLRRRLNLVGNQ